MNITTITEVNGKKLSKSQMNLLAKLSKLGVTVATTSAPRQNPYSGKTHTLEPLAVTLYDFIINQYHAGMVGRAIPVNVWNNARYFFNVIWPDQYYDLID